MSWLKGDEKIGQKAQRKRDWRRQKQRFVFFLRLRGDSEV